MTHHITDEQIAKLHDSMFPAPYDGHANVVRFARAVLALAAPQGEPYGWAVTGCHSLYRGEWAESTAQAEAKRCGGTAVAFPLYTAPAPAVPSDEREAFEAWATSVGYHTERDMFQREKYQSTVTWELWRVWQARAALTAAPTPMQPAVPEDVRMQAKMYRWLRDCAPADWLSRVCNVFSKRGAAFDEEVRAAMSAENGGV